ncbi:MAG: START domain-containing protein [Chlorobiales bacterium]|nr:START domain-containing protein [Chlorobiales bacterium]
MDVALILHRNWKFRVEHKGIKIFSSTVDGSDMHSFKGEAEMQVSLKKLISLFHDMSGYRRWVHQLADMDVLDKTDAIEYVVRQIIKTPWPLQEREVILRTGLISVGENSIAVTMKGEPDYLPNNPKYHRVRHSTGMWVFTPTSHGKIRITFVMHIDPGKDIPASISNAGMFDVPFYSMNNLRNLMMDGSYNPPFPEEIKQHLSIIEDVHDKP